MNLVDRIKGILLQPKSEWSKIESEPGDAGYLLSNYVAILAAIPPICTFIGASIIGIGGYRVGIGMGLVYAVVLYVLMLIGLFVVGHIIDFLAVWCPQESRKRHEGIGLCADRGLACRRVLYPSGAEYFS